MLEDILDMLLGIRLYPSENHLGHNAVIRILKEKEKGERELFGLLYLSYDCGYPKFLWMNNGLTASQREYIELKAQIEVEREIDQNLISRFKSQSEASD
jgi:hypothetical protein